ncbi:MAG: hypothetical protein CR972_02935 [Candidatus Moraniibacteriota bacterium]|nr:MAG: hypothetical protein CR972_02935 [Candidatus Moranbacteria bacterium]
MARLQLKDLTEKERKQMVGEFFDAISDLKRKDDVTTFLVDLLSSSELLMVSRRVQIAKMLLKEKSYREISQKLHVSETTISAVARRVFDDDACLKKYFKDNTKKKNKQYSKKYYRNIFDRYGQLQAIKDLFDM